MLKMFDFFTIHYCVLYYQNVAIFGRSPVEVPMLHSHYGIGTV